MADLFRKEALESFSSNSGMGRGIRAVGIRTKLFSAVLVMCALAFGVWLMFGTVLETVAVNGVVWPSENNGTVYLERSGTVSKLTVTPGQYVKNGDILAVIPQGDILEKLKAAQGSNASDAEIDRLYDEYDKYSLIRSNVNGIVTQLIPENTYVDRGGKIAVVVPYDDSGNNSRLTAFIPARQSGIVNLGMTVQVTPEFAPREEYGYINGYISSIGSYPVTGQYIKENSAELYDPDMAETENYIKIEITLLPDASAKSGLKWSNPGSGDIGLAMGTVCGCDIIINQCRPYQWLL
jgi:hypothetical protein